MAVSLVIFWEGPDGRPAPQAGDLAAFGRALAMTPGLVRALIHRPTPAANDIAQDRPLPALGLQMDFAGLDALQEACGHGAFLQGLPAGLAGLPASQQVFETRAFLPPFTGAGGCSYVVHYPGPAQDTDAWLAHYAQTHIPLMCRLPGVREVEMQTPIAAPCAPGIPRATHMQRNRVLFDDARALASALASPIRHEMAADTADYPPYQGGMFHYPMQTDIIRAA